MASLNIGREGRAWTDEALELEFRGRLLSEISTGAYDRVMNHRNKSFFLSFY